LLTKLYMQYTRWSIFVNTRKCKRKYVNIFNATPALGHLAKIEKTRKR